MTDAVTTVRGEPRQLIDGKLVDAASGSTFDNVNPATEEVLGVTSDAGPSDIDSAVGAARRAFDETSWSQDAAFRRRCIEQLRQVLKDNAEEFRHVLVAEAGCPIALTYAIQYDWAVDDLAHWAEVATSYEFERRMPEKAVFGIPSARIIRREPIGVVGAITPWNFPLMLNLAKLGPALAAGCTVVLKPAPDTPWSGTMLGRLIAEGTDVPAGVVNVVATSDNAVAERLVADPRVDMVTFTGSTAVGRRVMAVGSETVKKVFLELGGKSANIILDDADFPTVVAGAAGGICMHAGQGCAIPTRMLVPRSRYDEAVELAKTALENVSYGDPTDPANFMGPLISARQRDRVLSYIEKGKADGGRAVVGGGRPAHLAKGYYVEPTLFADVDPDATIAQEEIFGPVLAVIAFEDDDDAVRIANNSIYGLSGAVTSASLDRAMAVARRLRTGTVAVNGGMWFGPDAPFGGYRQSGVGREGGVEGFEEYLEIKNMGVPAAG